MVTKNSSGTVIEAAAYTDDALARRLSKTVNPDSAGSASSAIDRTACATSDCLLYAVRQEVHSSPQLHAQLEESTESLNPDLTENSY